ncbi:MAG: DNA repair protein RecO [Alphaproteobacteria bacterium]|nr:DNA repair protein RecO [Rhodospirillales bacterium]MCW9045886.1 DNA repair protein RecO [Alphaproteobacteria bacterium]
MEWRDNGFVLSARPHGEGGIIATLLTKEHGRHAGLIRGGGSRKSQGVFEIGNFVTAEWRARLAEHLGSYQCELVTSFAAEVLDSPIKLAGLTALCGVSETALPEKEPLPALFDGFQALLSVLHEEAWASLYVRWEVGLLAELGFGLDMDICAATGNTEELVYLSPKSGRAVSAAAGEPYKEKLLALPDFLRLGEATTDLRAVLQGLKLTGYFLERHVFGPHNQTIPAARTRFVDRLNKMTTISGR